MTRTLCILLSFMAAAACCLPPSVGSRAVPADESSAAGQTLAFERVPPTEPHDAEKTFRTLHGFQMQLLAAEPLVTDPVALEYDENGLAWVVEMRDYPYTDKSTDEPNVERTTDAPLGRIRILEDTDGDGRFDRSDVFAEDLSWPTGIALWKGGCYVTATPDVWYLKDTDGDRKADVRRRVFTGFRKLNVQGVINNLRWGLDHKLYAAGASNGGEITKPDDPAFKKVAFGKADFAFDPLTEDFEVLTGGARFGMTFDDWGNRFICNIRNPVQHIVLENRYLARNPYLTVTNAVHDAAEAGDTLLVYRASPPEPWRAARALRYRTETGGMQLPRSELAGEGYFTSACGITIYRGAAYPKEFYGNAFLGEVAGNLIHRQTIEPDGVTFKSRRADEGAEIVASTDNWFRPVNFTNAPDGTLHVCDMYRETIEHPWSIPDDMKAVLDLESGRDRGRIYRLAPPNFTPPTTLPQLGNATAAELVATLENPNSWWRDTAHRLIFERQDKECVEPLRKLLSESSNQVARVHALWSLYGLKALDQEDYFKSLHDTAAEMRRAATIVYESDRVRRPADVHEIRKVTELSQKSREPDQRVRFQAVLSLGFDRGRHVPAWLAGTLQTGPSGDNDWLTTAVLCSSAGRAVDVLLSEEDLWRDTKRLMIPETRERLAALVGAESDADAIRRVLLAVHRDEYPDTAVVVGLSGGLRRSGRSLSQFATDAKTRTMLQAVFTTASSNALSGTSIAGRQVSIRLLSQGVSRDVRPTLVKLLDARQPAAIQIEAVRALAGFRDADVPALLLKNYKTFTPAVRGEVVEALASRTEYHVALLDAVESKLVNVVDIPQTRRLLMTRSKDLAVAGRADKLFTQSSSARAAVIERFKAALKLTGDATRGHSVFARECKACHKLRGEGFEVGPNLATILHRTPDELLTHILDPNREVSPNYLEYVVELDDGRTMTGLIAEETAASLTLRKAENAQETVLRRNIEAMYATGKSLMPEGMEQKLTLQHAADLLAYLYQRR